MNKSEETDLRFAVFITLIADQAKEEKKNLNQETQTLDWKIFYMMCKCLH